MTFNKCTFNCAGKAINVYADYSAGSHDITVNVNDCTFNSTFSKQALNINDSNMGDYKYILNFTGTNIVTAKRDNTTCSQLFGFGGKSGNNTGRTDVKIEGELVWSESKMLTHDYTDGQHDDKFVDLNDYEWEQKADGWYCTGHAKCDYCGYKIHETVKADATTETSCTENGKVVYTATFQHKCFAAQTRSDDLDSVGHDWGEPTYTWNQDGVDWYCTATRVCKRDASHVQTETVKATYEVTTPATTEKEGAGLYTASFENDVFKTQTKDDVIAKLPVKTEEKEDQAKASEAQPILATTGDMNAFAVPVVLAVAAAAAILTFVALRRKNQR